MQASIWIAVGACLLACYAAACNIALKSFSRTRVADLLAQSGRAHRLEPFLERLPQYQLITGTLRTLLSFTVLLATLYGIEMHLPHWEKAPQYALAFGVAGFAVSIFVIGIPVSWARYGGDYLVAASIPVFRLLLPLLPLASVLHWIDPVVRRVSGVDTQDRVEGQVADQVLDVVEDHQMGQPVDSVQKDMLEAVFEFPQTTASDIMTPRTEVQALSVRATLKEAKEAVLRSGHSRIPVYQDNLDQIVGLLYAKDLLRFIGNGEAFDLRAALRQPFVVPESTLVRELLGEFKVRKVHLALVLDEYGGTAGLVTIEDILEEIVGEIQDEYEPVEGPELSRVDERTAEVDARMSLEDFNEAMQASLPDDRGYDTVGGFVATSLGHIPRVGEAFEAGGLRFTVTDSERTKVKRVRVERLAAPVTEAAAEAER